MLDLEPPKPTKEFHEAYMEIYGKGKKRDDKAVQKPIAESLSLSAMDVPPLKTEEQKKPLFLFMNKDKYKELTSLDLPPLKEAPQKKPLFSFNDKDLAELDNLDLPALKLESKPEKMPDLSLPSLDLPPLKKSEPVKSKQKVVAPVLSKKPSYSFSDDDLALPDLKLPSLEPAKKTVELLPAMDLRLEEMDLPPLKEKSSPVKIPSMEKADIESPVKEIEKIGKKAPVYDFLAEIKHGKRHAVEPVVKPLPVNKPIEPLPLPREIPIFNEPFEKPVVKGKDMEMIFERPLVEEKVVSQPTHTAVYAFEKPTLEPIEVPKVKSFKSPVEYKQYMKEAKSYEQKLKKLDMQSKKAQQEITFLLKKQHTHDSKLNDKMKKIAQLEKELEQKHIQNMKKVSEMQQHIAQKEEELSLYEPRMHELYSREDALKKKEQDIFKKQQELSATEGRLRTEENAIVAKIKRLEADQKLLEKEQNSIVKSVEKLENDKEEVAIKTREFADIMRRITLAEKELKERTDLFTERENRIKRKEQLVEKELARIETLKKKSEKLKEVEQTYERMKRRLRDAYEEYEQRFAYKESAAPQSYTIQPTVKVIDEKPVQDVDSGDITNFIAYTRKLVLDKKYEEANRNITKLMHRYMQVPDSNPRKKEIYYEILSIRNMLKLDLLD